ncbi:hypothetical protein [Glycomyces harbinensis]|uniref:DUF4351 domain-containing protein n=1 Tax=Glycomyces harbinensis TaxID=58114 RepID=A0A1G6V517_9ACTN|nr:hypothetical protein [Glycomyces harbinensis]SDD48533.1 hypothetical protein SAMN05216270_104200 [Glycomyces harbinensis]
MPGDPHEGVIKVLQDDPMAAVWLLGLADADAHVETCTDAETRANSVGSAGLTERRADLVLQLTFPDESDRILICEVQNKWSDEKYFRLPGYMTRAFEDSKLPVELLLICGSDRLAQRYAEGIHLGRGNRIAVHAVGPSGIPSVTEESKLPTVAAAVVAALFGKPPEPDEADQFASTLDRYLGTINPGQAADYVAYLLAALATGPAARLEELMQTKTRTYHSEYSDRLRSEGLEQGLEQGREQGQVEGLRRALVVLLENTQTGLTPEQRGKIEACTDLVQLQNWLAKFATDRSASVVLDG